jgi:hypothetical protein
MIDDTAAIEKAVMLYVDGSTKNDNALVKQAFDARARLFGGMMDGTRLDIDMPAFLAVLEKKPLNNGLASSRCSSSVPQPQSCSRKRDAGATSPSSIFSRSRRSTAPGRSSTRPSPTREAAHRARSRLPGHSVVEYSKGWSDIRLWVNEAVRVRR